MLINCQKNTLFRLSGITLLFSNFRDKLDFVSKNVQGKLAIRAVLLGDMKMLNNLIEEKDLIYKVNIVLVILLVIYSSQLIMCWK